MPKIGPVIVQTRRQREDRYEMYTILSFELTNDWQVMLKDIQGKLLYKEDVVAIALVRVDTYRRGSGAKTSDEPWTRLVPLCNLEVPMQIVDDAFDGYDLVRKP